MSKYSTPRGEKGGGKSKWNVRGVRRRRARASRPSQLDGYGRKTKGLDYGVKDTVTNSFEPDKTVPPPKGGYPENRTVTQKRTITQFNSRRG